MPDSTRIVINTGPLLALTAATGDLRILDKLYDQVLVPREVANEILLSAVKDFGAKQFKDASWLKVEREEIEISQYLLNSLDRGEASVIQLALDEKVEVVCIDETVGRRVARMNGLSLTGSLGVLLRASRTGLLDSLEEAIEKMRSRGIWLSDRIAKAVLDLEQLS